MNFIFRKNNTFDKKVNSFDEVYFIFAEIEL